MAFTLQIGEPAPDFNLPGVDGREYSLADFEDSRALIVVFSCNHCPYVVGSEDRMNELYADYAPKGVAMVAINSNETDNHPTDSFEHMVQRAKEKGFRFPYVRDDSPRRAGRTARGARSARADDQPHRLQRQVEGPRRPLDASGGVRPGVRVPGPRAAPVRPQFRAWSSGR
jgi:peroxiredoxin